MADLKNLKTKIIRLIKQLQNIAKENGIDFVVAQGFRSIEEQNKLYAQGRTKPGKVVTNARGGDSLHNFGVAFDVCPLVSGKADWKNIKAFNKLGELGKSLGLEWGGDWKKFPARPHFQYTAGYKLIDFKKNKIDWVRFELINNHNEKDITIFFDIYNQFCIVCKTKQSCYAA